MNTADKIWKARYDLNRKKTGYKSSAEYFSAAENADKMLQTLLNKNMHRVKDQLACLNFESGSSVLDIGAGPGTLAVPLAAQGCKVTALEPSVPMTDAMEKYRTHCGLSAEISVIHNILDDISAEKIGTFDYVVSSFAIAVSNLRDSLLKMNRLAEKQVHIFWFLNNPSWAQIEEDLWEILHPGEKSYRSHADIIWNCLYKEGIYANLEVYPMKDIRVFKNQDEALSEYSQRLCISLPSQMQILEEYLKNHLVQQTNGGYALTDNGKYAHIWWDKQ